MEAHPQIHIEDTPQFYDMEVFNRSVQTGHLLMSLDCWTEVHPSLVTLPVDWNFTIPYGLLYQLRPGADVARFVALVRGTAPSRRQRARRISGGRAVWPEGGYGLRLIVRCGKGDDVDDGLPHRGGPA